MDISLTYDEILGLPNEIIRLSSTHSAYNELLDSNISDCYDTRELKGKIASMFNRFKMLKYKCNIPIESKIKLSISYDIERSSTSNRVNNQIENIVLKNTVNDTIRMYEKGKIRMYKIVHKINPKVHSFVIL